MTQLAPAWKDLRSFGWVKNGLAPNMEGLQPLQLKDEITTHDIGTIGKIATDAYGAQERLSTESEIQVEKGLE